MLNVQLLDEAIDDLTSSDKPIARRITQKIRWLAENIENIQPEGLSGQLIRGQGSMKNGIYTVSETVPPPRI